MFTVARLGIDGRLAITLTTSNPIESMLSIAQTTNRNVTRWRDGQTVLCWTARLSSGSLDPPRACSTPNDPSAASRATNRCPTSRQHCM
jgi:putative transposase